MAKSINSLPNAASDPDLPARWLKLTNYILCALMATGMVLGGAPNEPGWQSAILLSISALLLPLAHAAGADRKFAELPLAVRVLAICLVALPLFQLVPLPPAVLEAVGGNELRLEVLTVLTLGQQWQPISVVPQATLFAFAMLLPAAAAFYAALTLDRKGRRMIITTLLGVASFAILIGLVQFGSKGASLDFYGTSHRGSLLGFFANRNHQGLLMGVAGAYAIYLAGDRIKNPPAAFATAIILSLVFLIASVGTASRAGIGLTLLGLSTAFYAQFIHGKMRWQLLVAGAAATAIMIYFVTFSSVVQAALDRFSRIEENGRLEIWEKSAPLIEQYFGLGAGIGSYTTIYPVVERLEDVNPFFFNRMHNDYLELAVETGIPGLLVMTAGAVLFGWSVFKGMRGRFSRGSYGVPAAVAIGLVALHSIVDYPLRTQSHAIIFAVGCAFVLAPLGADHKKLPAPTTKSRSIKWLVIGVQTIVILMFGLLAAYQVVQSRLAFAPGVALANSDATPLSVAELSRAKRQLARTPLNQELLNVIYANEVRAGLGDAERREYVALLRRMGWRDTVTQQNLLGEAISNNDINSALDNLDALLRRNKLYDQIFPLLAQLEAETDGMALVAERLSRLPTWRGPYFGYSSALSDSRVLDARIKLFAYLESRGAPVSRSEKWVTMQALVNADRRDDIADLARAVMPANAQGEWLFDPDFDRLKEVSIQQRKRSLPYEWQTTNRSGVSAEVISEEWNSRLVIRWNGRGAPTIAQVMTFLPRGSEPRMEIALSGNSPKTSLDALRFSLTCPDKMASLFEQVPANLELSTNTAVFQLDREARCDFPTLAVLGWPRAGNGGANLSLDSVRLIVD